MATVLSEQDLIAFGRRVQERRQAMGLSQTAFGEIISLHRVSVARIEAGAVDVPYSTMLAIAEALGVTVADLTADSPTRPMGKRK
ncbi:MAG: helix-turn-helix transcriptional regulator [Gemmataceae bacterium]